MPASNSMHSPCKFDTKDTLYLKLVGVEGTSNFTLNINYNYLPEYQIKCPGGINLPNSIYYSAVYTPKGTLRYGGKFNNSLDNNIYLLDEEVNWKILQTEGSVSPPKRYGHFMTYYEDYIIVFGGKNEKEEILNDLWILDLEKFKWTTINYLQNSNIPKAKFLSSGEVLKNYGQIVIFGGQSYFDDKSINILNFNILLEIIKFSFNVNDDQYFDSLAKLNKLWKIIEIPSKINFKVSIES
jgi:hypothetical protein